MVTARMQTGPAVGQSARARLRGRSVCLKARTNPVELTRRARIGLGELTDPGLLGVLTSLPMGEPVPWSMLDRRAQRALRLAPDGTVERIGSRVARLAVVPMIVEAVTLDVTAARAGLEAASMFAPFCRRSVRVPAASIDDALLLDAAFYGIGIQVRDTPTSRTVLEPAPFVVRRWTWASWQFHEQAWAQLRHTLPKDSSNVSETGSVRPLQLGTFG